MVTLMAARRFTDADGRSHFHDPNRADGFLGRFICTEGHEFIHYMPKCWCGWPTEGKSYSKITGGCDHSRVRDTLPPECDLCGVELDG